VLACARALSERRDRAIRPSDVLQVVHAGKQPRIAGRTELVQLDEAASQHRRLLAVGTLERRQVSLGRLELSFDRVGLPGDGPRLGDARLAIRFEPAELAEQGSLLREQRVGLGTKAPDPLRGSTRLLGGRCGAGRLRQGCSRERRDERGRRKRGERRTQRDTQ
jgi:hypothetical protein